MATSKKFSELPAASSVGNGDLFAIAHEDALAETGYVSQKLTAAQAGQKVNGDTEYPTSLPSFPENGQNPFSALEKLNQDIIDLYPVSTASGSIATFDTSLALPLVECKAQIVAKQAGSGTPSPTNVRNISGFVEVEIRHCGKNLFDPTTSSNINASIAVWALNDTNIVAFLNKLPIGNYKLSFKMRVDAINGSSDISQYGVIISNSSSGNITMRAIETDVVVGSIFERSANVNITNSNKGLFTNFWFYCGRSYAENPDNCTSYDFQLELGNTQTDYVEYDGNTYTIPLPTTNYGGVLDAKNGNAYMTVKYFSFSEALYYGTYGADNANLYYVNIPDYDTDKIKQMSSSSFDGILVSNIFTKISESSSRMKDNEIRTNAGASINTFYFRADEFADLTALNAFLANTPLQVVAELQTPTEITGLTPANFTTFAGEQNIFADCGDVEVSYKQGIQEYIDAKIAETQALIL